MTNLIALSFAFMLAVMAAGWAYQRAVGNAGWGDVFWTAGTGIACASVAAVPIEAHAPPNWRQLLIVTLMVLWVLRLGGYVARRVRRNREDVRYAILRDTWGADFQKKMFLLLIMQAPATALLCISVLLSARYPDPQPRGADVIGLLLGAAAIGGEMLADAQLQRFRARAGNAGGVCDVGLWSWSRHPNYFFEWLLWVTFPIIALRPSKPASWLSLMAPVVMFLLLRFATGVPPLEAAMRRSKGDAYRRYQLRVSAFFPLPPSRAD